jgi:hypothetical protein
MIQPIRPAQPISPIQRYGWVGHEHEEEEGYMSSLPELSGLVTTIRQRHTRNLQSDLLKLRTEYGSEKLNHALELSKQEALRSALSVSGARQLAQAERENGRELQGLFREKRLDAAAQALRASNRAWQRPCRHRRRAGLTPIKFPFCFLRGMTSVELETQ